MRPNRLGAVVLFAPIAKIVALRAVNKSGLRKLSGIRGFGGLS
jgi:hypothetical protein